MVLIDTSDPTRVRADLVCHATQTLATHHHGVATNQSFQALRGNVPCVCLCKCQTINSYQAYIIIPTQSLNNYITHLKVTRR